MYTPFDTTETFFGAAIYVGHGEPSVLHWRDLPAKVYLKWYWYFEYRAALLKVAKPKERVELKTWQEQREILKERRIEYLERSIKIQKSKLYKNHLSMNLFKENWTGMFSYEEDPEYQKACKIIRTREEYLERTEKELAKLRDLTNPKEIGDHFTKEIGI